MGKRERTGNENDESCTVKVRRKKSWDADYYQHGKEASRILDEYVCDNPDLKMVRECLTTEEVTMRCITGDFDVISDHRKLEIFNRTRKHISMVVNERLVCSVCDGLFRYKEVRRVKPTVASSVKWCRKLRGSSQVPDKLRSYYDVSKWFPKLKGALISRSGMERDSSGIPTGYLFLCKKCYISLKGRGRLPNFSIANGFDVGVLPDEFLDVTVVEKSLASLTSVAVPATFLKGGKHRSVKGHVSVMRTNPTQIVKNLHRLLDDEEDTFLVIIAGKLTKKQEILAMKRHRASAKVLQRLLQFYVHNNVLYQAEDVVIDCDALIVLAKRGEKSGMIVHRVPVTAGEGKTSESSRSQGIPDDSLGELRMKKKVTSKRLLYM